MESLPIGSGNLWLNLGVLLGSILCVAFFSSSEASLISVSKIRIRSLAEQGNRAAQRVQQVVGKHDKFFATILLTENAFIIFASSMGTAIAIALLGEGTESLVVATLVMTVLIVTFGEITPKTLAVQVSERLSMLVARPIEAIMWVESPFIAAFTVIPNLITRLLGARSGSTSPFVTEAELRMLIDIGETEGMVEEAEREMLHKVFRFADRLVQEVMTPRTEMVWLEKGCTMAQFLPVFSEHFHSRFPVYEGTPDNVIGVLYIKDVLRAQSGGHLAPDRSLDDLVRPAYFVPETKRVGELFEEMQNRGYPLAIIVDEYGGTAGLVTLRQLAEEIVGQASDELAKAEPEFEAIDEHTLQIDGGMRIDQANEELLLNLPEGDYETVGGFLLHFLGRIPRQGEQVRYDNLTLVITEMRGVRIEKVLVTRA